MLILVTMESGPSMNEDGRNVFRLQSQTKYAIEGPVTAVRVVIHDNGGLSIVTVNHAWSDSWVVRANNDDGI